jgi:lysophospholipase L1-like esterase
VTIRLRPGAQGTLIESHISINSRGFRGREIADPKGQTYRIVALGESTTFGYTINPEDKPWPELLEQLINRELKPARPVEVINAGIPGITLPENLNRFSDDILPLKPDMIICYHGINGFQLLDKAMPPLRGKPPPVYRKRPLPLLADCEYRLKLLAYQHTRGARGSSRPPTFSNLLDTEYARAYCSLIDIARTNNIRLVLANFPLAVNQQSPPELVEFFSRRHKRTDWYIRANAAHGMMVEELARAHSEVSFVNTRPHLDGEEEKYIDLMHLTQEGDRQLAWTFFDGIRDMLETELKGSATIPTAPGDSNAATQPAR